MMIAARLAGGNLFFAFFVVGDFFGGGFWEHSEQLGALGALGFFLRGFVVGGFFFLGGGGVCFGL